MPRCAALLAAIALAALCSAVCAQADNAVFISTLSSQDAHTAAAVDLRKLDPTLKSQRISYSGFVTVDQSITSEYGRGSASINYFFWFFEALGASPSVDTPVVLWLQGGPGCTSMEGLFMEMGPYKIERKHLFGSSQLVLVENTHSWANDVHMIFVDNPVGTGLSFAQPPDALTTNQPQVAAFLENVLAQFFDKFPEYAQAPFYVTGESYAGKYVPSLGHRIRTMSPPSTVNLVGLAIGDGFTNPAVQVLTHAAQVFQAGLVDEKQASMIADIQDRVVDLCAQEQWVEAKAVRGLIFEVIKNATDGINIYDYRTYEDYSLLKADLIDYLKQEAVRDVIHAGPHFMNETCSSAVSKSMEVDVMKSEADVIPALIDTYQFLSYQGQFDARDGVSSNEALLRSLDWDGIPAYLQAPRTVWSTNGVPSGYARSFRNLTQVVVRNAGHLVPLNQCAASRDMIARWINGLPWTGNRAA